MNISKRRFNAFYLVILASLFLFSFNFISSWNFEQGGTGSVSVTTLSGNLTNFTELYDTPDNYVGSGSKCVLVNAGETALVFGDCSAASGDITSVQGDNIYIYNGTTSGDVVLSFNVTKLINNIGNWSADKSGYYTSTQTDTEIQSANTSIVTWANNKFFSNLTNFTGTLTNAKFCTYNSSTLKIDCNSDASLVESDPYWSGNLSLVVFTSQTTNWDKDVSNDFTNISNFTSAKTDGKLCFYQLASDTFNCTYTDISGSGGLAGGGYYLYNDSTNIYLNDTRLNDTIDARDSDTTYTAGSNLTLTGTEFALNETGVLQWLNNFFSPVGSYLTNWLKPSPTDKFLYNDTSYIYFNDTKLNNTIDQRATGYIDNTHNYTNKTLLSQFENDGNFYVDNTHNYTNATLVGFFENNVGYITWANAINGTLYIDNTHNYTNFTKLSDFTNDLTFYIDNSHNYTNKTLLSQFQNNLGYLYLSNFTDDVFGNSSLARIGNCAIGQFVQNITTSGVQCAVPTLSETDPFWNANYSLFLTIAAWNNTGLIQNWNASGYIQNWNSTSLIINWNSSGNIQNWNASGWIKDWTVDIGNSNTTLYNWVVAQGYTSGGITWGEANNGTLYLSSNPYGFWNATFALFNKTYADTLYYGINNPYGFYNSTTLPASGGKNATGYLYNDSTTIYFNSTLADNNLSVNSSDYWDGLNTYNTTTLEEQSSGILGIKFSWLQSFIQTITRAMPDWIDWGDVTNGTVYVDNSHNYTNATLVGFFENNVGYITWANAINGTLYIDNTHNYTNFTKLSDFTNDLTFYIDNSHNYTNKTLLSQFENDGAFITWGNAINGTLALNSSLIGYYPIANPMNFTNKTLLSQFQNDGVFITWDKVVNGTVYSDNAHNYTNKTLLGQFENNVGFTTWANAINGTLYLSSNPYGFWNATFALFNKTYADTLYYGINNPYGFYNSTTLPASGGKNATGYLYNDSTTIYFNSTLADNNLSVNSSDYWDGLNTYNTTQLEEQAGGLLGIKNSWLTSYLDSVYRKLSNLIGNSDIAANSINTTQIIDGQVQNADIGISAVNTTQISDGSLLPGDFNAAVNTSMDSRYVNIEGDTMNGSLNISGANLSLTKNNFLFGSQDKTSNITNNGTHWIWW